MSETASDKELPLSCNFGCRTKARLNSPEKEQPWNDKNGDNNRNCRYSNHSFAGLESAI